MLLFIVTEHSDEEQHLEILNFVNNAVTSCYVQSKESLLWNCLHVHKFNFLQVHKGIRICTWTVFYKLHVLNQRKLARTCYNCFHMLTSKKFLYVTYALTQFVKLWLFVEMFLKYFLISHPFYLTNFKVRYRSLIENPLHQQ